MEKKYKRDPEYGGVTWGKSRSNSNLSTYKDDVDDDDDDNDERNGCTFPLCVLCLVLSSWTPQHSAEHRSGDSCQMGSMSAE